MSLRPSSSRQRSIPRLLAGYGLLTLLPVIALGVGLAFAIRASANQRGLAQGRLEASLIAQTAVDAHLDGRPLSRGLTRRERSEMERLVRAAVTDHHVLRLRLRDLSGRVVFSDGRVLPGEEHDDDALRAAGGATVAHLAHLNADDPAARTPGPAAVEVYLPLSAGRPARRIGVLELYLPYAPIAAVVRAEMRVLYLALGLGLAALYVVLTLITVSVTRRLRQQVADNGFLARYDPLTELPNRALFVERVQRAVRGARRRGPPSVVAIIDLDRFQEINDSLGHPTGDELLVALAARLAAHIAPRDTVARLGGDEYGLVLTDAEDPAAALERIRKLLRSETRVGGLSLSAEPSIGYVRIVDGDASAATLMQQADVAMYAAKAQHSGPVEFRSELARHDARDLELMSQLRAAIPAGQLVLHYQPQLDLGTGAVRSIEALVRWEHPEHGLLGPGRFLPMAERTELIHEITTWVLETALGDLPVLEALGHRLAVSVNASARSIVRPQFATEIMGALARHATAPDRLVIEVTETALLTDPRGAREVLARLSDAGVRLSLDDFGVGHTSLSYLSALPVDELKIDRGFVTDLDDEPAHAAIVRSVIDLGHNLALRVVAEGIETDVVLQRLTELRCDVVQGYRFARPMARDALADFLAAHVARRARPPLTAAP